MATLVRVALRKLSVATHCQVVPVVRATSGGADSHAPLPEPRCAECLEGLEMLEKEFLQHLLVPVGPEKGGVRQQVYLAWVQLRQPKGHLHRVARPLVPCASVPEG
eukprot:2316272-Pleurochrysis_carterae.AAC.3